MQQQVADSEVTAAAYTFRQPPQGFQEPKYRDPSSSRNASRYTHSGSQRYGNIMYDRRVYRGNTYASPIMSIAARAEIERREMIDTQRRKQASQRAASIKRRKQLEAARRHMATPDPGEGRYNTQIQTDEYLEELTDKVDQQVQETQTDPLMDRPVTPKYVPIKSGRDAETQIHEGDLFRFDEAVEPILEVLVGKTLEQAMLEVMQEEELELLRQQQIEFEQRRKEELLETQKLEAEERRKFEEKERRKKQEMERIQREKETREKLQARQFAKVCMSNMENRVFSRLQDEGWFADRVLNEVELDFFPWLMAEVDRELAKKAKARALVDELIRDVVRLNASQLEKSRAAAAPAAEEPVIA
ncbi:putative radial spoke protein 3 [Leishmania major strain Friedlin]|uniref:Putative radial spoke protein 3 n=1 Tax=Leishmania major TaxID=5664 RepID=E9AD29_LEIMA|nr:putative radial spoke protein 3 [Leishmania major strain Friedlin]CAG9576652.1 radial_spoke_protein_3_-_putative [Leishmania major strain Friedlin]CBZ12112.1 putative radial spoke protein 3 [Leishmania major strain Friedlin]|eukprot:XP_003721858.1 putative radial spoke protein 3 [Leishmania major strain Friedlin]